MGLYLCVFDADEEIEGVEVGSYADFNFFRTIITDQLEGGIPGSKYPTLILHSDSDGEWTPDECCSLRTELADISARLEKLPGDRFQAEWQQALGKLLGLRPACLFDCFIDVDGEPLLERLATLCDVAISRKQPILFQ